MADREQKREMKRSARPFPRRIVLVLLFFTGNLICYMDRVNISITAPMIMKELAWDEAALGFILSSFFLGYTLLQIPGGWLADRFGGKRVLTWGVLWWSAFTVMTPLAGSVTSMAALRTLMGLGEGVNFPSIQSMTARWIPAAERSRVMGFTLSGVSMGSILAFPLATFIMTVLGWRYVFYMFGFIGLIWCMFWLRLAADSPETHRHINPEELAYITANRPPVERVRRVPWSKLLSNAAVWSLVINHFCVSWGFFMFLTWLPTYLVTVHGFSLKEMGMGAMFPYIVMVLGSNATGWIADWCILRTGNITLVRKTVHTISLGGACIFLVLLAHAATKAEVIVLVTFALGLLSMTGSSTGPNAMDIAPRYAGTVMGMQTTAGNIAGIIVPVLVGFIVSTSSRWDVVFYLAAAVLACGAVLWNICATGRQVLE